MEYNFFSAFILLFLVTDPLGNIPLFIHQLQNFSKRRRVYIIFREICIASCVLLFFMLAGKSFLNLLHLSELSMQFAGSIIMFLIAINMIFPHHNNKDDIPTDEPFIVPLAIPLVAGPSSIATVMLLASQSPNNMYIWVGALVLTMVCCAVILFMSDFIQDILGEKVVSAFERLMGLILVAMSVEMFLKGIRSFMQNS
jgi:MarC family membrane protein